jgi:hypothetical protein
MIVSFIDNAPQMAPPDGTVKLQLARMQRGGCSAATSKAN